MIRWRTHNKREKAQRHGALANASFEGTCTHSAEQSFTANLAIKRHDSKEIPVSALKPLWAETEQEKQLKRHCLLFFSISLHFFRSLAKLAHALDA